MLDLSAKVLNGDLRGFLSSDQTALLPQIWVMAIVVAVLDAWSSSGRKDDFRQNVQLILAAVFQQLEGQGTSSDDYYIDYGPRAKMLSADISFWRVHAHHRRIDLAIDLALRRKQCLPPSSPGSTQYSAEMAAVVSFFIWLLDSGDTSVFLIYHQPCGTSDVVVYDIAKLLRGVGMKIETRRNPPSIKDPTHVVCLKENLGNTDSAMVMERSTDSTLGLLDVISS